MNTKVSITKSADYAPENVYQAVSRCIDLLGGIERFVKPGNMVLLKPNLLGAKEPEHAVTTHPEVVLAIAKIVKGAGGIPVIGDSPAIGSWDNIIEKTGMKRVSEISGASLIEFTGNVRLKQNGKNTFKQIEVAEIVNSVDVIINIPKLKTHCQMYLTLGVKNLYGFVTGKKKARLHLEAGSDPLYFATMLVELYMGIKPSLTIMDGILGMEGDGPGSGDPRHIGLILGGVDCIALDTVICKIIGADENKLFTNIIGKRLNAGEGDIGSIDILGEKLCDVSVDKFKFPKIQDVEFGPYFLRKYVKKALNSKPMEDRRLCVLCDFCIKACPPRVISKKGKKLYINYDKCIRCFCCIEVCPHGAMKIKKTRLAKILGI